MRYFLLLIISILVLISITGCTQTPENIVVTTESERIGEIKDVNPIKELSSDVITGSLSMPEKKNEYSFERIQEDEYVYSTIESIGNDTYTVSITPLKPLPIQYIWDYVLCGEVNQVAVKEERINYQFEAPPRRTASSLVKGDRAIMPIRVVNKTRSVVDKTVQKRSLPQRISSRGYCGQGIIIGNNRSWFNETIQYNLTIPYVEGRNFTLWLGNGTEGTVGTSSTGARKVSSSFTKRVWYSEFTNRWYAVGIDANRDVFIASTGDGENYTLGGVIDAGTYFYADVSCVIDEDGVSWLHCGYANPSNNIVNYRGIRLTRDSPYVDIGAEYTMATHGTVLQDVNMPRMGLGKDRCVVGFYQNRVSDNDLYVTKEAPPCGDGIWTTNSSYPVVVETSLTDDDGPFGFVQPYPGSDIGWFTWVDAVSGDFDFKAKSFNISNGTQGSEVLLEGDLEGGTYRKVDATSYNDSSGNHFVGWGAVDGDSTNMYAFTLTGWSDTSETTYSTSVLDPELVLTSSYYDDMTIAADTFYGNLYGVVLNDTDGNEFSFANSTDGGSTWTHMGDLDASGVSTIDQFTSGYSNERCEVMVGYHTSFQSYEMRTHTIQTNTPCKQEDNWWDSNWNSRINLTFDTSSTTEALVNYPLLVKLNSSLIDYNSTQNSGQDIRFVDMDKETELDYEIETWNETGESIVWVRVFQLNPTTNHTIYLYYNNTGASDAQDSSGVWQDFVGVFHLDEISSGTGNAGAHKDSSGNIDGDDEVSATGKDGIVGLGQEFDGSNDVVRIDDIFNTYPQFGDGNFTVEGWFYHDSIYIDGNGYFRAGDETGFTRGVHGTGWFPNRIRMVNFGGTGSISDSNVVTTSNWQYFVWTQDDDTTPQMVSYVNASNVMDLNNDKATDIQSGDNFTFGGPGFTSFAQPHFDGEIDEFRISDGQRSEGYVNITYEMISSDIVTFGSQENNGGGGGNATDTCTCPSPAAAWEIDLSDNCVLSSTCNLAGYAVTFIGSGTFTCNASLTADSIEADANLGGIIGSACSVVYG